MTTIYSPYPFSRAVDRWQNNSWTPLHTQFGEKHYVTGTDDDARQKAANLTTAGEASRGFVRIFKLPEWCYSSHVVTTENDKVPRGSQKVAYNG